MPGSISIASPVLGLSTVITLSSLETVLYALDMFFAWLKRYMPTSLYGRAALILIVPVLTLQIVVSLVFIQRHFEGVTTSLSNNAVMEIRLLQRKVDEADTQDAARTVLADLGQSLQLSAQFVPQDNIPTEDQWQFWDITRFWVHKTFRNGLPELGPIILDRDIRFTTYLPSRHGMIEIMTPRGRVSPDNSHQLIVWTAGIGGLMILIAYLFLRNQLRPIKRLSYAAEAFGKGRHLPYKPTGAAEVRSAGNAFLEMRTRIERYIEQRTLILSGVSHDLRTPLTRLKLALSMSDDPSAKDMEKDVIDMQRLLDEFLVFARRDAEAALEAEPTDAVELVKDVVSGEASRGVNVNLVDVSGSGKVELRPLAIRRAIVNLIGNATLYGSRAEVSVVLAPDCLRIVVEDDGPGIPEDQREQAVKPFARLDPARNQNDSAGVGLGLSITADVARAHGGYLDLSTSVSLGGLKATIVIDR